jgi:hypothetical protein
MPFFLKMFDSIRFFEFCASNGLGDFLFSIYRQMSANEKSQKIAKQFSCELCDYICFNKFDFNKHLSTRKHTKAKNSCDNANELSQKIAKNYICTGCNTEYRHQSSLCKHTKVCNQKAITTSELEPEQGKGLYEIINKLLNDNHELRNLLISQASDQKEIVNKVISITSQPTTIINNTNAGNTNSNNKFNVNVFLDNECKDAMNFEDFVNGIEVSQEDIQNNGRLGFVDGISKIIMDNLNRLSVNQRPIHCTDWKREVLYIKDDNKWTKETDAKKIRDAIQVVSQKSIRTLHAWKMSNPDYKRGSSDFAMECIDMQLHSVAGEKREVYYPKVAKLIAKHVLVDKNNRGG